ncbi:hypothetical protein O181_033464 [Austropuccinia psidii MF-1]|uniref:Uncharacterized protein n=1 Tax=Austropuccinia psidii MF-1 TaxID=1389203 RepID=A0A9Q3H8L0_9BASI|nr:hypothetical protein [Austropuccinia psidii MF-1]
MYGIDIYNSKDRHITIVTNNEKKMFLHIYQISNKGLLEKLLNEFKERKLNSNLTIKQKLSLLKILRENRPAFAIGKEPLGNIRGHHIKSHIEGERPDLPILRRHPCPESLQNRKDIEKHINELLDIDVIIKMGHNQIGEVTTPVLLTFHYGKARFCEYFR